jgi:diadenosine tetraphosphatase ApaH/serine/threonine PP2A family protein phosphatase
MNSSNQRTLIVGDVHGCYDEMVMLLKKMDYDPLKDKLIFVGDVINRGPKSFEVLKFISTNNCLAIKGNHEIALLKYAQSGVVRAGSSFNSILRSMGTEKKDWLDWIESWPLYLETDEFIVVHGGLQPGLHPRLTKPEILTRIRTWDGAGHDLNNLSNKPWDYYYRDKKLVVFGHWSQRGLVVKENIIGLDSGCVWGGSLSAVELPRRVIYQVESKKAYRSI